MKEGCMTTTQKLPNNLYRTSDRITMAAPMPGLGPEDICVRVDDRGHVTLEGRLCEKDDCGALKGSNDVLTEEWTVGPYLREIDVPDAVDGTAGIVTYGNGVLVVSLPFAETTRPATLRLQRIAPDRGANASPPNQQYTHHGR
jgi:HSP20 family molecular chaperone IbpA